MLVVLNLPGHRLRVASGSAARVRSGGGGARALGVFEAVALLAARDNDDVRVEVVGDLNHESQLGFDAAVNRRRMLDGLRPMRRAKSVLLVPVLSRS